MSQEHFEIPGYAPQIGAIYAHYKNLDKEYRVTGLSLNSDSDEWHVEYIPLYEGAAAPKFKRSVSTWMNRAIVDSKEVEKHQLFRAE